MKLKPTEKQIDAVLKWCDEAFDNGTHYPGESYEEGAKSAILWMRGDVTDSPME
jgi:hypothetical protein